MATTMGGMVLIFATISLCLSPAFCTVGSPLGRISPDDINLYTLQTRNAKISSTCLQESALYFHALLNHEMWALKMFDASSKFQSGVLGLNLADLGAFDECIGIRTDGDIQGKYCLLSLIPSSGEAARAVNSSTAVFGDVVRSIQTSTQAMNKGGTARYNGEELQENPMEALRWSICVPSGCSTEDVLDHINAFLSSSQLPMALTLQDGKCQTKDSENKLRQGDWWFIAFLIVILCAMIACTSYDIYLYYTKKESKHPILLAFSWYTNGKKYLAINNGPEQLPCLHGLRFISMMWVVLGHQYKTYTLVPVMNLVHVGTWMQSWPSLFITGSTVSVDTFFVLSGCLLMYGFMRSRVRGITFNIPLFYLHRYLRLTPALAVMIVFHLTLLRVIGSGPVYNSVTDPMRVTCEKWWWTSFLYVQNYVNPNEICVDQTWYLQADMQLFWLSPLVLWPCAKWKRYAPYYLSVLIVIFTAVAMFVGGYYKFNAAFIKSVRDPDFMSIYYLPTHTRACTWLVGIALGYLLFNIKDRNIRMSKVKVITGWTITTVVLLYILFGIFPNLKDDYEYEPVFNTIYLGLHRTIWALGISWIIFACVHGYGGPINAFLSLPIFHILGKLTYCMYLTHMTLENLRVGQTRQPVFFSDVDVLFAFWGSAMFDVMVAIVWIMAFEAPMGTIDGLLFGSGRKKEPLVVAEVNSSTEQEHEP